MEVQREWEAHKELYEFKDPGCLPESLRVIRGKDLQYIEEWRERIDPTNARATVDERALTEAGDGEQEEFHRITDRIPDEGIELDQMGRQVPARMKDDIQEEVPTCAYHDLQAQEVVQRTWDQEEDGEDQQVSSI